jgi:hypothetical protein
VAKGGKHISDPFADAPFYQARLTEAPGFHQGASTFVDASDDPAVLEAILETGGLKGNDWEFRTEEGPRFLEPTVCAVTAGDLIYSAPWSEAYASRLGRAFREGVAPDGVRYSWAAHSYAGADKAVADKAFGHVSDVADWECSMVSHFLCNQHLCKASEKDEEDPGSLGFMGLGTMATIITDQPQYKKCRNAACPGPDADRPMYSRVHPCPSHSVCSYCGQDAWLSPKGHLHYMDILERMGMGLWFYRDMMELSEECYQMEKQGIKVNLAHIIRTNEILEEKKAGLFPSTGKGKKKVFKDFSPQSSKQIIAWFKERKIKLKKTDKENIKAALEELALKEGVEGGAAGLDDHEEPISYTLRRLWDLFIYKSEGKGLDPWFHEKYFPYEYHQALKRLGYSSIYDAKKYDPVFGIVEYDKFYRIVAELEQFAYIHPRFVQTGTSSGRWSSSRPNATNLAKRGFGELVRKAIIARSHDKDITKADAAQLELRFCLWLAGTPYAGTDAFRWLVLETGTQFHEAARIAKPKEFAKKPDDSARNVAKVVSHSSDYLQGFILIERAALKDKRTKELIESGALRVYAKEFYPMLDKDWTFHGKLVAFTGSNLANTLFKDKSAKSRKKALDIQEDIYFKRFWSIREWQIKTLRFAEQNGYVQSPVGRFLRLFGMPEEQAKISVAFLGQGGGSDYVQGVHLRLRREHSIRPIMVVHDEIVTETLRAKSDEEVIHDLRVLKEESTRFPGFFCPWEIKRWDNWNDNDMRTIYKG